MVNDETVVVVAFFILTTYLGKSIIAPYKAWADGHIEVRFSFPSAFFFGAGMGESAWGRLGE